ncbi:hypothetical protein AYI70_g7890 [Smittium culicis]|uniref:IMS import disulfide relay-system CHCH-CHCH-like Cx9C domain-containing protein n=1 Tax=Smittium culicis TaxID=133412 RepID=A0A1R1X714_9FUNG|nr:hypothetical protein AYI70_g10346 [Smittium culicis]OMJ14403.1 hypothetical protein AYI70_g7890 [Smittium culicis]
MESILDEVSLNCANQIQDFYECVETNQTDWKFKCSDLETALSKCSEKYSKKLLLARSKCQTFVNNYETCIKSNQSDPQVCINQLKDLYNCTNDALESDSKKQ